MLRQLSIRNLAVIEELALDFDGGFSVLTGETGAGKSILIDALGLLLGDRADAALVRAGATQAEVSAEFDVKDIAAARAWLADQAMENPDDRDTCLVRRVVMSEGRTRATINGAAATAAALRDLGERLVEIHGQNEHQSLLRGDAQRALLDEFGSHRKELEAVASAVREWRSATEERDQLRAAAGRDPAEIDLSKHQLRELEALALEDGELERLDAEQKRLAHAGKILEDGAAAEAMLYGGEASVHDQLSQVRNLVARLSPLHEGFVEIEATITDAQVRAQEAARAIRGELDRMDLDPQRLAEVERRIAAIHDVARKHRVRHEQLPARLDELRRAVDASADASERLSKIDARIAAALTAYRKAAGALTAARKKSGEALAKKVSAIARELGMPKAQLVVAIENASRETPSLQGDDDVRFDFSANPGQPARSLAKTASGGELSRLSLAIQLVANRRDAAATLIFDEVDAGIGGGVAEIVGRKLRELAAGRQVLSVTHLPQVAAQGEQHYAIGKEVRGKQTFTNMRKLARKERVEELARMQAGVEVTSTALDHARELLERARSG
ncbi:MAG TPA: DNA repair protein RecN [Nevskiaceae bacterium]|nr:DNA repair protein RecN [Nevskiaceae bacterium]